MKKLSLLLLLIAFAPPALSHDWMIIRQGGSGNGSPYWLDPVAAVADLPACDATALGASIEVGNNKSGNEWTSPATYVCGKTSLNVYLWAAIPPSAHASAHHANGSDEMTLEFLTTACSDGEGVLAASGLLACTDLATQTDLDDQTATEVAYTPTTGGDWDDPDPTDVGEALDTLAAASGGGSASSSGTGLQYGDGSGGFTEVTSSSVSGADVTLGGDLDLNGAGDLILDADADTYLQHIGDDTIRLWVGDTSLMTFGSTSFYMGPGGYAGMSKNQPTSTVTGIFAKATDTNTGPGGYVGADRGSLIAGGTSVLEYGTADVAINVNLDLEDPGSKPTCDSSARFMFHPDEGGVGVADTLEVCMKDSGDAYAWVPVATP